MWILLALACAPEEPATPPQPSDSGTTGGSTVACDPDAPVGTLYEQTLRVDGEQRVYLLHVPEEHHCDQTWPVLFDLHGTASGLPEEAYGLQDAIATADEEGFVLVRPRSRSGDQGGYEIHRWDQNPGDPELNHTFLLALTDELSDRYGLDPDRRYAMGFSSGTNQVAVLAEDPDAGFAGFAHIGGGAWTTDAQPAGPRYYLHTPFRDYMRTYHRNLVDQLDMAGVPEDDRYERTGMSGHELYGWAYPELWAFLDRGERPGSGTTTGYGWQAVPNAPAGLLAVHAGGVGLQLVAGQENALYEVDGDAFAPAVISGAPLFPGSSLTSVCVGPTGIGAAAGNGSVLWTDDGGASWRHLDPVDEPGPMMFGYAHWNGVGCGATEVMGVGYWSAGIGSDGVTFEDAVLGTAYRAQAQSAAQGPSGRWVTVGYYKWLAWSEDGRSFVAEAQTGPAHWLLDVAAGADGLWVAVGDQGAVLRSDDDAESWTVVHDEPDLEWNAVSIRDDGAILVVGRSGRALYSSDGGLSWEDASLGSDALLADAAWLPDGRALVVGPAGAWWFEP